MMNFDINGSVHDIIWPKHFHDRAGHGYYQEDVFPLERRTQNREDDSDYCG